MWITISSCELYCAPENKLVGIPVLPLAPSCYPEPSEPSCGKRLAVDMYTLVRFGRFNLSVASGATLSPPVRGLNGLSGAAMARWRLGGLMSPSLKHCSVRWGDLRSLTKLTEPFP